MRFKKGSKVEVMNKEVPVDIISGNGHGYNVRYNGYQGVEKVSRSFVRLRPSPSAVGSQNWVNGDIVEVFDESSWKVATVLKILKGGRFLVRPHGFTREIRTRKMNIRAWISVGKISGSNGVKVKPKICQEEDGRLPKRKRSSTFCSSIIESKKVKHVETDGGQSQSQSQSQRRISGHSFEKVDAFEGNKYMQASFNNSLNGYYEMEKRKTYGVGCDITRISEPNESDNDDECSVGSCSVVPSDGPNKLSSHYDDADGLPSDGESFNTSRAEHEVAASIHRLELHAYRSTLEALYASGPLSWEKEALLTNLRINLNISNDEHLTELRHLISSGTRILD